MDARLLGALLLLLPSLVVARLVLWRHRHAYWLAVACLAVGTGYLMATGATADIANALLPGLAPPKPAVAR